MPTPEKQKRYDYHYQETGDPDLALSRTNLEFALKEGASQAVVSSCQTNALRAKKDCVIEAIQSNEMISKKDLAQICELLNLTVGGVIIDNIFDRFDDWLDTCGDIADLAQVAFGKIIEDAHDSKAINERIEDAKKRRSVQIIEIEKYNEEKRKAGSNNLFAQYRGKQLQFPKQVKEQIRNLISDKLIETGWDNPSEELVSYVLKLLLS